jgi:LuxR family transcriptional regulator, maltose regulon positive regulatory protein
MIFDKMQRIKNILRTKLNKPPVLDDYVHRVRLIEKLNLSFQKTPLTLVCAPAGYGKSNLVSSWLSNSNVPYGWISLDENDNNIHVFLDYFFASLENIFPGKLHRLSQMLSQAKFPTLDELINVIINELDEVGKNFVLVLDDYQVINNKEIHSFINRLLQFPPENLHLCITTRTDPQLNIGSLRAYNRMHEIRLKDLAFDLEEIPVLYSNLLGFEINDAIAEELLNRTEGWITGLRLTAFSVKSPDQLNNLLFKLRGDALLVTEYLIEEVLLTQPEGIQEALINTSILERFNGELLNVLNTTHDNKKTKAASGHDFLKWLENTNLFLVSLDYEQKWYRYHFLFRELLLKQLKSRKTPQQISALHRKISKWFEKKGFVEEAIKHALKSGEPKAAVEIVERNRFSAIDNDRWLDLEKWVSMLPGELINDNIPMQLCLSWIGRFNNNKVTLTRSLINSFNLLGENPKKDLLYGEFCCLYGFDKFAVEGNPVEALDLINEAMKIIPAKMNSTLRAETEQHYVILMHTVGRSEESNDYSVRRLMEVNNNYCRLLERMQFAICAIHLLKGDLINTQKDALKFKEMAILHESIFEEVWSSWFLGTTAFYRYELEEAAKYYQKIVEIRYKFPGRAVIDGMCALAVTYQMLHNQQKTDEILNLIEEYTNWTHDKSQAITLIHLRARLALIRGETDEAVLHERQVSNVLSILASMFFYVHNGPVIRCAINVAEGTEESLSKAATDISEIYDLTVRFNQLSKSMSMLIIRSIYERKIGKHADSLKSMKKAVEFAEQNEWIQPFMEFGHLVKPILVDLSANDKNRAYCKKLVSIYEKGMKNSGAASVDENTNLKLSEPISQREKEILELLSHGYKNKEIGDRLFLASTTVKKHVYNLYQKLDVHSRFEVITKAKKLGLI